MSAKIIHLHNQNQRDEYMTRLRTLSQSLQELAEDFRVTPREALADLTYVVVGDDIMTAIQSQDS